MNGIVDEIKALLACFIRVWTVWNLLFGNNYGATTKKLLVRLKKTTTEQHQEKKYASRWSENR